jgi:hypothetical protein
MTVLSEDEPQPAQRRTLRFRWIPGAFAVSRLAPQASIPDWALRGPFVSITRAADELSIVCLTENVPNDVKAERNWCCFQLEGPFPFMEVGILNSFIGPLAQGGIPIFVVSSFDTDYVLLKEEVVGAALSVLSQAGHELVSEGNP